MTRGSPVPVLLAALAFAAAGSAHAREADEGLVWRPQPCRGPVAVGAISPDAPYVAAGVPTIPGDTQLEEGQAVTFWLDPLQVVRVCRAGNSRSAPRFGRLLGGDPSGKTAIAPRGLIAEPGVAREGGCWDLAQPPGAGSVWYVEATASMRLHLTSPESREGRLVWDDVQRAYFRWVDSGGKRPSLPHVEGGAELELRLDEDAATAAMLSAHGGAEIKVAARAWRKAKILQETTLARPLVRPYFRVDSLTPSKSAGGDVTLKRGMGLGAAAIDGEPWNRIAGDSHRIFSLEGPGVLRVEGRAVLGAQVQAATGATTFAIRVDGIAAGLRKVRATAIRAEDPNAVPVAFPDKQPLSAGGDWVGERESLAIPLVVGRHDYDVSFAGGAMLVRITTGTPKLRLADAVDKSTDPSAWISAARSALNGNVSGEATFLRAQLDLLEGKLPDADAPPEMAGLAPLLRARDLLARLGGNAIWVQGDGAMNALVPLLEATRKHGVSPACWALEIDVARLFARNGATDRLRAFIATLPPDSPPAVSGAIAEILPEDSPLESLRSRALAAEDLAWRGDPADLAARRRYLSIWNAGSAWHELSPLAGEGLPPEPATWIRSMSRAWSDGTPVEIRERGSWERGLLWRLSPGVEHGVTASTAPFEPTRPAVLRVWVRTPDDTPGPFTLNVDGSAFSAPGIARLEPVAIAVAPGPHQIRLDGPPGTEAFVGMAPAELPSDAADLARVVRRWPVASAVHFPLPDPVAGGPVQIELSALVSATSGSASVTELNVRTETGGLRVLRIAPGAADPSAETLGGYGLPTTALTVVVPVPPGSKELVLETLGAPVLVSISVRRPMREDDAPAPSSRTLVEKGPALERAARASRALSKSPKSAMLLVTRAHALLDLGEVDLARQDFVRALRVDSKPPQETVNAEDALLNRLDAWSLPTWVRFPGEPALAAPRPIAPAWMTSNAPPASVLRVLAEARKNGPPAGLEKLRTLSAAERDGSAGLYLAARLQEASGADRAASRAWLSYYRRTGSWQAGLESLGTWRRLLASNERAPGDASLAYGVAASLRSEVELPAVRQTLVSAAGLGTWDPLHGTETNGGTEKVLLDDDDALAPLASVRRALIAAPWPEREARVVAAGKGTVLDLAVDARTSLRLDLFARDLRTDGNGACRIAWRLDGSEAHWRSIPAAQVTSISLGSISTGEHEAEVSVGESARGCVVSAHFVTGAPVISQRRAELYVARPDAEVAVTVRGPTVVRVEARTNLGGAASSLEVSTRGDRTRIPLASRTDSGVHSEAARGIDPGAPTEGFLFLPDAAAYRVTMRPSRGIAYVRLAARQDISGVTIAPPVQPWWQLAGTPPTTLAGGGGLGSIRAVPAPHALLPGTISIEALAGHEDTQMGYDLENRGTDRAEVGLAWRQLLLPQKLWLRAASVARMRERATPSEGGRVDLYARVLPFGIRTQLTGEAYRQRFSGAEVQTPRDEWSARGEGYADRSFRATSDVLFIPSVALQARRQSLSRATVLSSEERHLDPVVFTTYAEDHPLALTPKASVWWLPFQDQVGAISAGFTTNKSLRTIDHSDLLVEWRTLLTPAPWLDAVADLSWHPTLWYRDANRAKEYVRHRLGARLEPSIWAGRFARIRVFARDDYFFADVVGRRNVFEAGLRIDVTGGRGLRDMLPVEQDFDDLLGRRYWVDRPGEAQ